ncbi:MAG TPA: glycosyltransferase [Candidatus Binatia bacterium]|nr:glycosyltransferase [Candidatus Binatia bacterium]
MDAPASIDVIIPARGETPWLADSLLSIAAQTLAPAVVILVDDGVEEPGDAVALGERLFGGRFRLLANRGRGISAALNTGIASSSATWIARMDADDVAHPDRFEKQVDFLAARPNGILGCGSQVRFMNASGKFLVRSRLLESWEEIAPRLRAQTCFIHSSLMIQREALLAAPYRPALDGAEDVDLVLRLAERGRIVNLAQPLLDYRIHLTQESFRMRARHTAIQELAFRLSLCRQKIRRDPLDEDPELAEKFIGWRLSTPGYFRARTALTALRYAGINFSGRDLRGLAGCVGVALHSFPVTPAGWRIAWRVYRKAGAALLDTETPFKALNMRG